MKNFVVLFGISFAFVFHAIGQNKVQKFEAAGIPVIFEKTSKDIIDVSVYYRGGVADYEADEAGIATLSVCGTTECGTKNYSKDEYKNISDKYGINIFGYSSYDYSRINLNCVTKYFDAGWRLLVESVKNPDYNKSEFDLLKQKVVSQIDDQQSSPDSKINLMAINNLFEGTIYKTNPQGTEQAVSKTTAADAKHFYYSKLLNKKKIFIVVIGKISKENIVQRIETAFGQIPSRAVEPSYFSTPVIDSNSFHIVPRKLATNYIIGVVNAPKFTSLDFVANRLAIATFSSDLFNKIRIQRNLSYRPYAYTVQDKMPYTIIYVSTTNPKASIDVIINEINRIKKEGFSEKEFENSKNLFITNNYIEEQSSYALASSLGNAEILGDWKMPEKFIQKVQKTTPDEMSKVFRKYINGIVWNFLGNVAAAEQAKDAFNEDFN